MSTGKPRDMLGRTSLLPVDDALKILENYAASIKISSETVHLDKAMGRVTAQALISPENLPPASRSTMDGFAVRAADTFGASETMPAYLTVSGEVRMGENPEFGPLPGNCFRIATGGLLPPDTDSVIMLEHTVRVDDTMIEVNHSIGSGTNVIGSGDDIGKGQKALPKGRRITPRDIGLLAGLGIREVRVYKRIRVGIFATGDEIVTCDQRPPLGKVRDINSVSLGALVYQTGNRAKDYGIVPDEKNPFSQTLHSALADNDIVLFSGSSSVGMRDLGEQVLSELGPPGILVHGVALRPGKPVIIAGCNQKIIFGLPGHPVSALVCFDIFIRSALDQLSGRVTKLPGCTTLRGKLMRSLNSAAGRRDYIRAQVKPGENGWEIFPVLAKSGAISSLSRADGYLIIPESSQGIEQETEVTVQLFE